MKKVYYEVTPKFLEGFPRYAERGNFQHTYDLIFQITQNHDISEFLANLCEISNVGYVHKTNLLTIKIIDDEV